MDEKENFRILIIDDNPSLHSDIIKSLTKKKSDDDIQALESKLFTEFSSNIAKTENGNNDIELPHFEIITATQGQEGVELISHALKEQKPFALAFVNIRMPPVETIENIWSIDKNIQIVICTAYSDYAWEETISRRGDGSTDNLMILKKPFDNITVKQLVCALTRKWQLAQ